MTTLRSLLTGLLTLSLTVACTVAQAQPGQNRGLKVGHYKPSSVATYLHHAPATPKLSAADNARLRRLVKPVSIANLHLRMTVSYLKRHKYIDAETYARLNRIPVGRARTELRNFARGHHAPLRSVKHGRRLCYRLA